MKAVDLIKYNPWLLDNNLVELKQIVNESNGMKFFCINNAQEHSYDNHEGGVAFSIDEIKQIIESYEIIAMFKNIDQAKIEVEACESANHLELLVKVDGGVGYIYTSKVKRAIVVVEGCI